MPDDPPSAATPESEREQAESSREPLRELTLGRPRAVAKELKPRPVAKHAVETDDIAALVDRCRTKAETARWAAERLRRIHERTNSLVESPPSDPEICLWAEKLTDGYYWRNAADAQSATEISALDDVAGCCETVAEALALVRKRSHQRAGFTGALNLLAEAQSALRQALHNLQITADPDQLQVFEWLRTTTARERVFLPRFLRDDDRADPAAWPGLLNRIEIQAGSDAQSQKQKALFRRLQDHLQMIRGAQSTEPDWLAVIQDVEELVGEGIPPSSRDLRELLRPVIDDFPLIEDLPPAFQLVQRAIDSYLATRPHATAAPTSSTPTPEVVEAAWLLRGRSLVLIGGTRRPDAQKTLTAALGLEELLWIETREHQSIRGFEPAIARPEVALVLLAIRWSSHAFGDVSLFCDRHHKPLVRLPGGYSPNQVATQILAQCSGQLKIKEVEPS